MNPDSNSARSSDDDARVDPMEDQLTRAPRAGVDPTLDPDPALYVPAMADGATPPGEGPFPAESRDLAERLRDVPTSERPELREGDVHPLDGEVLGDAGGELLGGAGGAVTGGVIGAIVGGPLGAVAGGVIGAGAGVLVGRVSQNGSAGDVTAGADETSPADESRVRGRLHEERGRLHEEGGPGHADRSRNLRALDDPDGSHLSEDREVNP